MDDYDRLLHDATDEHERCCRALLDAQVGMDLDRALDRHGITDETRRRQLRAVFALLIAK